MIDNNYSPVQIDLARQLLETLELKKVKDGRYQTALGYKDEDGLVNLVLETMFPIEDNNRVSV